MFNFKEKRLKEDRRIGSGNFGEVFPYQKDDTDFSWVVKRMNIPLETVKGKDGINHERTYQKLITNILKCFPEIVIGFSCEHPCIVPVKGYFIEKAEKGGGYKVYMKLPRMEMSLADEWNEKKANKERYDEAQLVKYFYSLASGVEYLHRRKIFHRDIKINNILLDVKGNVKLSDVGTAKYVTEEEFYQPLTGDHGTINYKAPELAEYEQEREGHGDDFNPELMKNPLKKDSLEKLDSWSLGVAMLELCTMRNRLINPYSPGERIERDLKNIRKKLEEEGIYSNELLDLVFSLLVVNPEKRRRVIDLKNKFTWRFQDILTEDYMKSLGLLLKQDDQKEDKTVVEDLFILKKMIEKGMKKVLGRFEEKIKKNKEKIENFEERIMKLRSRVEDFKEEMKKMLSEKNKIIKKLSLDYGKRIEDMKRENQRILAEKEDQSREKNKEIEKLISDYEQKIENIKQESQRVLEEKEAQVVKKTQKRERLSLDYGEIFQNWKRENEKFLERKMNQKISTLEDLEEKATTGEKLKAAKSKLQEIWGSKFQIRGNDDEVLMSNKRKEITDQDLEDWVKIFVEIYHEAGIDTKLNKLEIALESCEKITDSGVKSLSESIGTNLKDLKHLQLSLISCHLISDAGVQSLGYNIGRNLKDLNCLSIIYN